MTAEHGRPKPQTRHHLLPHERLAVTWMLERQQTHRTTAIVCDERNYGPEGVILMGAALSSAVPGAMIVILGMVIMFASFNHNPVLAIAHVVMIIGVVLVVLPMLRILQASSEGRAFRNGRPFDKSRDNKRL